MKNKELKLEANPATGLKEIIVYKFLHSFCLVPEFGTESHNLNLETILRVFFTLFRN